MIDWMSMACPEAMWCERRNNKRMFQDRDIRLHANDFRLSSNGAAYKTGIQQAATYRGCDLLFNADRNHGPLTQPVFGRIRSVHSVCSPISWRVPSVEEAPGPSGPRRRKSSSGKRWISAKDMINVKRPHIPPLSGLAATPFVPASSVFSPFRLPWAGQSRHLECCFIGDIWRRR